MHYEEGLLWYSAQSLVNEVLIKIGLEVVLRQSVHQGSGDRVCCTIWEKAHALESLLGNADGADVTTHARMGVEG